MQADACAWPVESKQTLITAATAVWFSLATLFIITRLCTRYFIVRQMAFDDWTILGAQVSLAIKLVV